MHFQVPVSPCHGTRSCSGLHQSKHNHCYSATGLQRGNILFNSHFSDSVGTPAGRLGHPVCFCSGVCVGWHCPLLAAAPSGWRWACGETLPFSLCFPLYDTWPSSCCAFLPFRRQLGRLQLHLFAYSTFSHLLCSCGCCCCLVFLFSLSIQKLLSLCIRIIIGTMIETVWKC